MDVTCVFSIRFMGDTRAMGSLSGIEYLENDGLCLVYVTVGSNMYYLSKVLTVDEYNRFFERVVDSIAKNPSFVDIGNEWSMEG